MAKDDYYESGALWRKKHYFTGVIRVDGVEMPLFIFPNKYKLSVNDNLPDYKIFFRKGGARKSEVLDEDIF